MLKRYLYELAGAQLAMTDRYQTFMIQFKEGDFAPAMHVPLQCSADEIIQRFGLLTPRPALFMSGGASAMGEDAMNKVREWITEGLAPFAEQHNLTVIDGGTEAGIMQILGEVHDERRYKFPLVGVAPLGRVRFPGHDNPNADADLQRGHTHFVLVESNEWGGESQVLTSMTRAIANRHSPMLGVLINGGQIAERDVYLATAQGEDRIPMLIVSGSGRKADEITKAYETGVSENAVVRAIIQGGSIRIAHMREGLANFVKELSRQFKTLS